MTIESELEALIRATPASADDLDRVAVAAALLADYRRLDERARGLLAQSSRVRPAGAGLAGLALHEAARRVLIDAGIPLHAVELGNRMKARGWRHPRATNAKPDQIVHQIAARLPKYGEIFRRTGPQTFGLAAWGSSYPGPHPKPAPPTALFYGAGGAVGQRSADADAPMIDEDAAWRSS